jgi:hypothetical protein
MRTTANHPSNLYVATDTNGRYLSLRTETPFYLGQKVSLPTTDDVQFTARLRTADPKVVLGVSLCDKMLLYSDNCRGTQFQASAPGTWVTVSARLSVTGLGASTLGIVRRPVELSLFDTVQGSVLDVRDITLVDAAATDDAGRSLLANGDFSSGLDRWLFTDDSHLSWHFKNQYLLTLFETGAVGMAALLAAAGLAVAGAGRAVMRGDPMGAAVAGSVAACLVSWLFDDVLEVPRITSLFFLVCWCGLLLWENTGQTSRSAGQ